MKANRYLHWHQNRRLVASMEAHLSTGGAVVVATMTRATKYRRPGSFRATRSGIYAQSGRGWVAIGGAGMLFVGVELI